MILSRVIYQLYCYIRKVSAGINLVKTQCNCTKNIEIERIAISRQIPAKD